MINLLLVGFGYWGKNYVSAIEALPGVMLRGVVDLNADFLKSSAKIPDGVGFWSTFEEALANVEFDAVVISTPVSTHAEIGKAALIRGKHVLIEKPLSDEPDEVLELTELASSKGLTIQVGLNYLTHPCLMAISKHLEVDGNAARQIRSQRWNFGPTRGDVSVIDDLLPHDLSIATFIFDSKPSHIQVIGDSDFVNVSVLFEGGAELHSSLSWLHPIKSRQMTFQTNSEFIVFDELAGEGNEIFVEKFASRTLNKNMFAVDRLDKYNLNYAPFMFQPDITPLRNQPLIKSLESFASNIQVNSAITYSAAISYEIAKTLKAARSSQGSRALERI